MAKSKNGKAGSGKRKPPLWWVPELLAEVSQGRSVSAAAALVGIDPTTANKLKRRDASFAASLEEARATQPEPAEPKRGRHWKATFLEHLAQTSNVTASAAAAITPVSTVYKERRTNRDFAREWAEALQEGYAHLELETLERLRNGVPADGNKFDIANALRLLTLHKDSVARERSRHTMEDEEEILLGIERKIDRLRTREREGQKLLADLSGADGPDGPHA